MWLRSSQELGLLEAGVAEETTLSLRSPGNGLLNSFAKGLFLLRPTTGAFSCSSSYMTRKRKRTNLRLRPGGSCSHSNEEAMKKHCFPIAISYETGSTGIGPPTRARLRSACLPIGALTHIARGRRGSNALQQLFHVSDAGRDGPPKSRAELPCYRCASAFI